MLLIRNGHVIDTEPEPHARPDTDILIADDGTIAAVGPALDAPAHADVIDAVNRIVLPGFVDTHRHVWQSALRVVLADGFMGEYFARVLGELGPRYTSRHMRTAELAGAFECLDSGITTVVDFSQPGLTSERAHAAVDGLRLAGIRAVFGVDGRGDHEQAERLREIRDAYESDLLTIALASLAPDHGGDERARRDWDVARELGLRVMVHLGSSLEGFERLGLLAPGTLYVHAIGLPDDGFTRIAETGGAVSVCPTIEGGMAQGFPVTERALTAGAPTGLGADAVTNGPGDMFSLMRTAYAFARVAGSGRVSTADILRMATLDGAVASGLGDTVGSLRPGKQADIVLLRTDRPAMAAAHDPIAAVVHCADTSAVDTVLVAGRVVKRGGALTHVDATRVVADLRTVADELVAADTVDDAAADAAAEAR
ncbi:amidohydrolase family protein [Phytoactinopolyspora halotolerans]|uniref:Amidohydrolase family protein n=1 Tax=Phytoactinopolyspora halotolerans TaxID=1981512 RepID=A0A6L9SEH5_9ACTN|nr:amidohydrolase family protein [Phytoactinopolyspora halotolerans]NEE02871.1 amidohydrolase family protein [Phytoactinopolyspora halotolerans]